MKEKEKRQLIENQANRLKSILQELDLNQSEFASNINVCFQTVNDAVNKRKAISANLAQKIENQYNINSKWLLTGEGEKYRSANSDVLKENLKHQISCINSTIEQLQKQVKDLQNELNK